MHGDYEYGLAEVLKLHTIRFHYKKNNALNLPSDKPMTGFIAQEVQKVIPDAVHTREDGYLELNVDPIHWAVVNALQELYHRWFEHKQAVSREIASLRADAAAKERRLASVEAENAAIKAENAAMKAESAAMKARLDRLEKRIPAR